MSTDGKTEAVGSSGLTRDEQLAKLLPMLRNMMPSLIAVGTMYEKTYPTKTSLPEVLDAVTVAVPLRQYMVLVGYAATVVGAEIDKERAAAAAKVTETTGTEGKVDVGSGGAHA